MPGEISVSKRIVGVCVCAAVCGLWPSLSFAQQAPPAPAVPDPPPTSITVTVVATTPLEGVGITIDKLAAPAQVATAEELERDGSINLASFMNNRLGSVYVNEIQNNPYQPDVNYRGYTASPLLGTPQGISVYMDGVRLNQPFGDVVSWDLIPRMAIRSMTLMPGSNPVFGLNTLGGSLSVDTKDGRSHPGTLVQPLFGRYMRRGVEVEHGGSAANGMDWYLTGNLFGDDGWREDSTSEVRQFFGKLGWLRQTTSVQGSVGFADNELFGNGLQERRLLDRDYASIFTKPDITDNRSTFLNLTARRSPNARLMLSGNVYYRNIRTSTLNGDINEDSLDQSVYQPGGAERAALAAAGYTGVPASGATAANTPFPFWRCLGNILLEDEPGEKCNGLINRSASRQRNAGAAGQLTLLDSPSGGRNQLTIGAAFDRSRVDFGQSTELGYLNSDRSVTGTGVFADGESAGDVAGEPYDARVDLEGRVRTASVYATNTTTLSPVWALTVSGRFNSTTVDNRDQINPGGGPDSLDGKQTFSRFNPAIGVTFSPNSRLNGFVSYSEASRAPTSIEVGCANPERPCKLPNAMAGDPPLEQVRTGTWEAGLRSREGAAVSWNAGWFLAENHDDILFVASEQTGFGYFKNFGETRRHGLEFGVGARRGRVELGVNYTFLHATFESEDVVLGEGNSSNEEALEGEKGLEGNIEIEPGDRIPLIPAHTFKAFVDVRLTPKASIDVNLVGVSSAFARGNENNGHAPDGTYYLGPGASDGYVVVNLGARVQVMPRVELFGQVSNLFNREYATAAQLGPAGLTAAGEYIARALPAVGGEFPVPRSTFFAPGAPINVWGGARVKF
jgi:outer membrane receptor protein involved in Fe transport